MAQEAGVETGGVTVDVTTFTGMAALVAMIVTQFVKKVPAIGGSKLATVGVSIVVGILVAMVCWWLGVSDFLLDYNWWQVLLTGVVSGLGSSGLYDFIKGLFGSSSSTEE